MITTFRGRVGCRSIVRNPVTERVLLPFEFTGLSLLGGKLRAHLPRNRHESATAPGRGSLAVILENFDDVFRVDKCPVLLTEEKDNMEILWRTELARFLKEIARAI